MKESEAWKILAEEHDAGRTVSVFLCPSINHLRGVSLRLGQRMRSRIRRALNDVGPAFSGDPGDSNYSEDARQARVLACLLFSEQAKEEAR